MVENSNQKNNKTFPNYSKDISPNSNKTILSSKKRPYGLHYLLAYLNTLTEDS